MEIMGSQEPSSLLFSVYFMSVINLLSVLFQLDVLQELLPALQLVRLLIAVLPVEQDLVRLLGLYSLWRFLRLPALSCVWINLEHGAHLLWLVYQRLWSIFFLLSMFMISVLPKTGLDLLSSKLRDKLGTFSVKLGQPDSRTVFRSGPQGVLCTLFIHSQHDFSVDFISATKSQASIILFYLQTNTIFLLQADFTEEVLRGRFIEEHFTPAMLTSNHWQVSFSLFFLNI